MSDISHNTNDIKPLGLDLNTFLVVLHLSQLLNIFIPSTGFIAPIVLWLVFKDQSPKIDLQGKNIVNWVITSIIISAICYVLSIILVGLFFMYIFMLLNLYFIVRGAIASDKGELYRYPLAIPFFK